jgi:hypothetical protein
MWHRFSFQKNFPEICRELKMWCGVGLIGSFGPMSTLDQVFADVLRVIRERIYTSSDEEK